MRNPNMKVNSGNNSYASFDICFLSFLLLLNESIYSALPVEEDAPDLVVIGSRQIAQLAVGPR